MPEAPFPKAVPHPLHAPRTAPDEAAPTPRPRSPIPFAELAVTTNYTFLTGASHPEEFVHRAADLGHHAAAIADTNTLAGVVRAHVAAKERTIQLCLGTRLVFRPTADLPHGLAVLAFPTDRPAYARLCRLLTLGKRRAPKGECHLDLHDLLDHQEGLAGVVLPPPLLDDRFVEALHGLRAAFADRLSIAAPRTFGPDDALRLAQLADLSALARVPLLATADAHYHARERRRLQDVLTCIRHGRTLQQAGLRLLSSAERHLKTPEEMARLFADYPAAVARTAEVADMCRGFSLDQLRHEYPEDVCPPGVTKERRLEELTLAGAREKYPGGVPPAVKERIDHELAIINDLDYAAYFLTCHDLVAHARSLGILCQGRGAAANSAVCFCLGITSVDPAESRLLFERFISRARKEPPDIDIDFEHERREEVIQYLYSKYGRDRAALTAEVITYRGRSAVREVGKALGLSLDRVDALAKALDYWGDAPDEARVREAGLDPKDPTVQDVLELTRQLIGFPRHLSQHVGGFVITRSPLCELVPIENAAMDDRTVIEWDKDDIEAVGLLKYDVLGLGMLTCISRCFGLVNAWHAPSLDRVAQASRLCEDVPPPPLPGEPTAPPGSPPIYPLQLHTVPWRDDSVFDMICAADTIGVFQIESRAQMSMLPRLRPRTFYDLVIEVAIVRPGPIQGNMVHPYLRRRNGEEPVVYPNDAVRDVLERTLGVPLFQEQAMALAIVAGGFSAEKADQLRRAMAGWKRKGDLIYRFGQELIAGMIQKGYSTDFAERCFEQIKGFSEYGFPESHAASFARIVYVSAWLKRHHPAAFAAALINSQPMGFYQPAQIVRDAQDHAVEVRPADVNFSHWDCTLEHPALGAAPRPPASSPALRLGLRLVKSLRETDASAITAAVRAHGPILDLERLRRLSGVRVPALRALAQADAFRSMGLDRQAALWHIRRLRDEDLPLFDFPLSPSPPPRVSASPPLPLPAPTPSSTVLHDYRSTGLSLKAHPISFVRKRLDELRVVPAAALRDPARTPAGRTVSVAGVVLVRQRPGTASGIVFITLEDETAIANLIVRAHIFERYRRVARTSGVLLATGRVERQGEVVHVLVTRLASLSDMVGLDRSRSRDFH